MAQSIQQARVDKGTRNNQIGDAVRQAKGRDAFGHLCDGAVMATANRTPCNYSHICAAAPFSEAQD